MDVNYQQFCNKVDRLQRAFSIESAKAPCYTDHINVVHFGVALDELRVTEKCSLGK